MVIAVVLRRGEAWREGVPLVGQVAFEGHVTFVSELKERNVAIEVGPLADPACETGDDLVGLALLDVGSVDDARALMGDDPMVGAGVLAARVYLWGDRARFSR